MNSTLKKIVNISLALIILDIILPKALEILEIKPFPSLRRIRRIKTKL